MAAVQDQDGKQAVSEFFTLEEFPQQTLLKVAILTGRTHQIRVHLAFLGCPVSGDTVYGRKKPTLEIDRQFLHAQRLSITLPGEKDKRTFEAPLPRELEAVLADLRNSSIRRRND
jgi:23S rRNA pseudouridine1911/1915/1917 synthase